MGVFPQNEYFTAQFSTKISMLGVPDPFAKCEKTLLIYILLMIKIYGNNIHNKHKQNKIKWILKIIQL